MVDVRNHTMTLPALPDELVAEIFDRCDANTKALALRRLSKAHRQRYRGCVVVRGPEPPPQLFERWVKTADRLSYGQLHSATPSSRSTRGGCSR